MEAPEVAETGVLEAPRAPESLDVEVLLMRAKHAPTQAVKCVGDPACMTSTLLEQCVITAVIAVGVVSLEPDVKYIAVLARATTMSLGLIVNSVVVPTGIGINANVVMDQVNIQPKRGR